MEVHGRARIAIADDATPSFFIGQWSTPGLRAFAALVDLAPTKLPLLPASGTVNLTWERAIPALASLAGDFHVDIREPGAGPLTLKGRDGRWELTYQHRLAGETRADLHLETSLLATEWLRSPLRGSLDIHSENVAAAIRQLRGAAILMPSEFAAVTAGRAAARGSVGGSIREPAMNLTLTAAGLSASG